MTQTHENTTRPLRGPGERTDRLYDAIHADFLEWCRGAAKAFPVAHRDVAAYLRRAWRERGPSTVPQQLSAIAALYRHHGHPLDTKSTPIQDVMVEARAEVRPRRP